MSGVKSKAKSLNLKSGDGTHIGVVALIAIGGVAATHTDKPRAKLTRTPLMIMLCR